MPIHTTETDLTDLLTAMLEAVDVITRPGEAAEVTRIAVTISEV